MISTPKYHHRIHNKYWLIANPEIKEADQLFGDALAEDAAHLPADFILSPVIFSTDKLIYFHGGDFLPLTHMPMPWADNQPWINQYPEIREVGFVPLFASLISDSLYQKLRPMDKYGDNLIDHAEYVLQARSLGARCFVTPHVH